MRSREIRQEMQAEEIKPKGFDLKVTYRDEKTGLVTHKSPYILRVVGEANGGKKRYWERPAGSGNIFNKHNEPVGRWLVDEKTGRGKFVEGVEHIPWAAPETEDQKLARSVAEKDSKIAVLEKELASLRKESEKKTDTAVAVKKA